MVFNFVVGVEFLKLAVIGTTFFFFVLKEIVNFILDFLKFMFQFLKLFFKS